MGRIHVGIRGWRVKAFPEAGRSADVSEVFLRRRLRLRLRLPELRRDLVDLLRLRLELLEADLHAEDLRQDGEDGLRTLRVDEVPARLPHQADGPHAGELPEAEDEPARADDPRPGLAAGEHDAVLLHLLHEVEVRRGPEDAGLRDHPAHPVPAEGVRELHPEARDLLQDAVAELVLPLRREPLVVPDEDHEVPPPLPLHVVELVVHELHDPVLLDEDLGREILREHLRELDGLQLVLQVLRRELPDVPDPGQPLDEDRVVQLRVLEVPHDDVFHGPSLFSCRRYRPWRSSGEYLGGIGLAVAAPHLGHTSRRVYARQSRQIRMNVRIVNLLLSRAGYSLRTNFPLPPFASRCFRIRAAAFWISSSAVL